MKKKAKKKAEVFRIYATSVAKILAGLAALILAIANLIKEIN